MYLNRKRYKFNERIGGMMQMGYVLNKKESYLNLKFYWIAIRSDGTRAVICGNDEREKGKFFEFKKYGMS